jgi:hypothetical protein
MKPENYSEVPTFVEAIQEQNMEKMQALLDLLPDNKTRREQILETIDILQMQTEALHDDREQHGDEVSPRAVQAAIAQNEKDRKDPNTFLGKLTAALETYKD